MNSATDSERLRKKRRDEEEAKRRRSSHQTDGSNHAQPDYYPVPSPAYDPTPSPEPYTGGGGSFDGGGASGDY